MKLIVNLEEQSYPIYIENNLLGDINTYIKEVFRGKRILVISDDHVFPLYGERLISSLAEEFSCSRLVLPHGEAAKSFDMLPRIYTSCLEAGITRSDLIIALGGGVIGDLAGFAASTFFRGVPLIQIPTSLLAQVDSSVGGKVAVDLPQGKNLVGTFYQPRMVLIDPTVLDTLPERFIHDGMGEIIKYGCIRDAGLFRTLETRGSFETLKEDLSTIIYRCVNIKRKIVEKDQFDFGERMLLNFGHTLGHTIEQYFHYERESHGEAIAIGMYQLTRISEAQGLTTKGCAERLKSILTAYQLPYECHLNVEVLVQGIQLDKKNLDDQLNLILLRDIGSSYIYKTTHQFFGGTQI